MERVPIVFPIRFASRNVAVQTTTRELSPTGVLVRCLDPRRAFPRYPAKFAVRFATVQDFVLEYAANISAGGVFVHTEDPPPLKTVVRIEMELPGGGQPVPARGVIVHRVTPQEAQARRT